MSDFLAYTSVTALMFVGILLIFIVLLQRGRGGGLAGALGGAGGQSALGTKAGDVFTKITIGLATIWILLACLSIYALRSADMSRTAAFEDDQATTESSIGATGEDAEATEDAATNGAAGAETPSGTSDAETTTSEEATSAASETGGPALGAPAEPAEESAGTEEGAATGN